VDRILKEAMKKVILGAALVFLLLCTLQPATAAFPSVHQEEIEQQRP
jgi:hypothetical protein